MFTFRFSSFLVLLFITSFSVLYAQSSFPSSDSPQGQTLDEVEVTGLWKIPLKKSELARGITTISSQEIRAERNAGLDQLLGQQAGIIIAGSNGNPSAFRSNYVMGATGQATMYMIDGIPVINPFGNPFELRSFSTRPFQKVEIVKGANSVLYGSSAIAGIINMVTKDYDETKSPFGVNAGFSYGSFNAYNYDISVSKKFKNFGFNVGYEGMQVEGLSEATSKTLPQSSLEKDGFGRNNFNAKLFFRLGNKVTIEPFIRYSKIAYNFDADAFLDSDVPHRVFQSWQSGVKTVAQLNKTTLYAIYSATLTEDESKSTYGPSFNVGRAHYVDVYATTKFAEVLSLVGGVQAQVADFDSRADKKTYSQFSVNPYASLFLKWKRLFAEGGLRVVYDNIYNIDFAYNLAVAYQVIDPLRLSLSYTSSYLAPNLTQLYGQWGPNPDLLPQQTKTLNFGINTQWFEKRLQVGANAYLRDTKDAFGYTTKNINNTQERQYGVEVNASFAITKDISVSAWYNYMEGFTEPQNGQTTDYLVRRPVHSVGGDARARLFKYVLLHVGAYYYGERNDIGSVKLDPYALVNLNVSGLFFEDKLEVYAGVRNLTNTDFVEAYGYTTLPLNFSVGFRVSP